MRLLPGTTLEDFHTLFNRIDNVYYHPTPGFFSSDAGICVQGTNTNLEEWPVLSDGVTFNTGSLDVTKIKITTKETWTTYSELGDSDIKLQLATINHHMLEKFFGAGTDVTQQATSSTNINWSKYGLTPQKVTGSLLLVSEDETYAIALPSIEAYGTLAYDDGKPMYVDAEVTPIGGFAVGAIVPRT